MPHMAAVIREQELRFPSCSSKRIRPGPRLCPSSVTLPLLCPWPELFLSALTIKTTRLNPLPQIYLPPISLDSPWAFSKYFKGKYHEIKCH